MRKAVIAILSIAALSAAGYWGYALMRDPRTPEAQYLTSKVERRDLVSSISATGTLSAVVTVAVGSEISGQIKELSADFNSQVKKDEIIARIAPESYQTLVRQAQAELAVSHAKLITQQAAVARYRADLSHVRSLLDAARAQTAKIRATFENADRELKRKESLVKQDFISKNDYDTAVTAFAETKAQLAQSEAEQEAAKNKVASAQAGLVMARAQITEAEADIELKEAALEKRRVDLDHTLIRSPVDGIVIARQVDVGQTVAASLQAPTLFTIAQDLSKMQVSASVDEADIGRIHEGQEARFTVDAYESRKFFGKVIQIRKDGQTVQNVVTYTVIISADNPALSLMPGMTADVVIDIHKTRDVLAVANAALRFTPPGAEKDMPAGSPAAAATDFSGAGQAGESGRTKPAERIKRLTRALDLSENQQNALNAVFKRTGEKIRAARESGGLDLGRQRDQLRKESRQEILMLLTPEQKERFNRLSGNGGRGVKRGVVWQQAQQARPVSVPVVMGISDGTYTEISGPGVREGMEILTGTRQ